jgi:hypothetical protein
MTIAILNKKTSDPKIPPSVQPAFNDITNQDSSSMVSNFANAAMKKPIVSMGGSSVVAASRIEKTVPQIESVMHSSLKGIADYMQSIKERGMYRKI